MKTSRMMRSCAIALTMLCIGGTASAQSKYYMRERIVGMSTSSTPTYDGVWKTGTTWTTSGACTAFRKPQTRNDTCTDAKTAAVVDASRCDPATKPAGSTRTVQCNGTCNAFVDDKYVSSVTGGSSTAIPVGSASGDAATMRTMAADLCEGSTAPNGYPKLMACYTYLDTGGVAAVYGVAGASTASYATATRAGRIFSTCQ